MINKALRTLYIYNGIFVLAGGLLGPLYAVYVLGLGQDVVAVSTSWSVFLIATTLCTFIISKFGDRMKEREYLLMAGYLIKAVVWILYIFTHTFFVLILLQILLGIGEAMGGPAFNALIAEHLDKGRHIEEYSDMSIIFNLAAALATMLGGFIVARYGFTPLFVTMAVLALISFFGIAVKPRRLL